MQWMELALEEARQAYQNNEVPIGAVIVQNNQLIVANHNQTLSQKNACAHAEILCIQEACHILNNHRLTDCHLYITLEPCMMCYGAIIQARIPNIYFGAFDKRTGVFSQDKLSKLLNLNHHPDYQGGILEDECQTLLTQFFKEKR